jgi:low temperature requirement protein LtrA
VWAERAAPTTWHPQHIAERYGLLTMIVVGESILAAMLAVQSALAAVGAGLAVSVDHATHHSKITSVVAGAAVTVPVAVYLLCLWFLHDRVEYRQTRAMGPFVAVLILLTMLTPYPVLLTGLTLATLVGVKLVVLRS